MNAAVVWVIPQWLSLTGEPNNLIAAQSTRLGASVLPTWYQQHGRFVPGELLVLSLTWKLGNAGVVLMRNSLDWFYYLRLCVVELFLYPDRLYIQNKLKHTTTNMKPRCRKNSEYKVLANHFQCLQEIKVNEKQILNLTIWVHWRP